MLTFTVTLDSLALYIAIADIVVLLAYILYVFHKKRKLEKAVNTISDFIIIYFGNTGCEVSVHCIKLADEKRYAALIESQPLKRFRFSSIIESNLIAHIAEITGYKVEKIYWRFPVKLSKEAVLASKTVDMEKDDAYFLHNNPANSMQGEYNVSEISWDQYEDPSKTK